VTDRRTTAMTTARPLLKYGQLKTNAGINRVTVRAMFLSTDRFVECFRLCAESLRLLN